VVDDIVGDIAGEHSVLSTGEPGGNGLSRPSFFITGDSGSSCRQESSDDIKTFRLRFHYISVYSRLHYYRKQSLWVIPSQLFCPLISPFLQRQRGSRDSREWWVNRYPWGTVVEFTAIAHFYLLTVAN